MVSVSDLPALSFHILIQRLLFTVRQLGSAKSMHDLWLVLGCVLRHVILLGKSLLVHRTVVQSIVDVLVANLFLKSNRALDVPLKV